MNYGQKIAELRKKADMTQAELGESLSVTSQAVSKWENGLSEPDLGTINKICELFNVSANDFFETTEKSVAAEDENGNGENKNEEVPAPKIINGYCEKCHKPVGPNEYKVFKRTEKVGFDEDAVYNSVQEILCNDCAKKKEAAVLAENERKRQFKIEEEKKHFRRGLIWGGVGSVVALIIAIVFTATDKETVAVTGAWISVYGMFTLISQLFWVNSVAELLAFFCKSFTMPGIIFTLDIDRIIWAICVKVLLAILSVVLSVLWFATGLVVSLFYSMIAFPFGVTNKIKEIKKI